MERFSRIDFKMEQFEKDVEARSMLKPAEPFSKAERTKEKTDARVKRAMEDYRYFDEVYFPAEMYQDYAAPGKFHNELDKISDKLGVQVIAGPRGFGKSVELKKKFAWKLLSGKIQIAGTLSHTMPTSSNILNDIRALIEENPRIMHDWDVKFQQANDLQFQFSTSRFKHYCYMAAFSAGRSVRGYARMFSRPEQILCDDMETKMSPFGEEQVKERIDIIAETYSSLSKNKAAVYVLGNNFDVRGFINVLLMQQNEGILEDHWRVHIFKAWDGKKSLWPERYPAKSEKQLRKLLKPKDESDWGGNFQQEPTEDDGDTFPREIYPQNLYRNLPADAKGVMWCDPNLSKKGKGDTTAIAALLYSPELDEYYVYKPRCLSFKDSNKLLDAYLEVRDNRVKRCGFDGHVNQESTWTNNVRNYCRINNKPVPPIFYEHYSVEDCAKNAQTLYIENRLKFPEDFAKTKEGQEATKQLFAFKGKKKPNKKDDFPDLIICLVEFIHDQKLVRKKTHLNDLKVITIQEPEL